MTVKEITVKTLEALTLDISFFFFKGHSNWAFHIDKCIQRCEVFTIQVSQAQYLRPPDFCLSSSGDPFKII